MKNDIKVGYKYKCIKKRFFYQSGDIIDVNIVGKIYEILSIKKINDNYIQIYISTETNEVCFYTQKNDHQRYYFHEYFVLDVKSNRKNKLKKIYESNL